MRRQELLEQHLVRHPRRAPVVAPPEPVQRRRAGQRVHPPDGGLQRRVVAQFPVVVEILVAERRRVDPLPEQIPQAVAAVWPGAAGRPDGGPPTGSDRAARRRGPAAERRRCR